MPKSDNSTLKRIDTQLEKKNAELTSKLERALLDLKKEKLNRKEEKFKCKERLFQLVRKIKTIEDKLIIRKHETPLTRTDYDVLLAEEARLKAEIEKLEKQV